MFDPSLKSRKKFWKFLEQLANYYEDLPLERDQKLCKTTGELEFFTGSVYWKWIDFDNNN